MTMARKKAVDKADEVQITVRLTPGGIAAAYEQLDKAKQRLQKRARQELGELMARISARSTYMSEEEAMADIDEALREVRAERRQRTA